MWHRSTRKQIYEASDTVGLRGVSKRLQAWKAQRQQVAVKDEPMDASEEVKKETNEEDGEVKMEVEEKDNGAEVKKEEGEEKDSVQEVKKEEGEEKDSGVEVKKEESEETDSVMEEKETTGRKVQLKVEFGSTEAEALCTSYDGVMDVSNALLKHTHYPKVAKPLSKLDSLLERRIRQHAYEMRQKSIIEQVLMKFKIQENARKAAKEKQKKEQQQQNNADLEIEAPAALAKKQKKQDETTKK